MKRVFETINNQTLTVVADEELVTIRIAKDGHNRGIAKLTLPDAELLGKLLTDR